MEKIVDIKARQVLDSRGNPTVEVDVYTQNYVGTAIDPSGASTGIHEALELRDGGRKYHGKGVTKAVSIVNTKIRRALLGKHVLKQSFIDGELLALDGTKDKHKLGANSLLAVSMAVMRAAAASKDMGLFEYVAELTKNKPRLPVPYANIINGGKHADGKLPFQEFMIVPVGAKSFSEAARLIAEVYYELKGILKKKYGAVATHVGDEGGFAPPIDTADEALRLLVTAITKARHTTKMKLAMDAAASEFYHNGMYLSDMSAKSLERIYMRLARKYPLISLEDPFDQEDFVAFRSLTKKTRIQIVGDDLTVSNPQRIKLAISEKMCNALLLKVNQIGTMTEALRAAKMAKDAGWNVMVSHRSGETEDCFIADLAVGLGCGQIKLGACARGERTAKYNQLLRIEEYLGRKARYGI